MLSKKVMLIASIVCSFLNAEDIAQEIRGKILSSSSKPITLSPVGGYFMRKGDDTLVGMKGLQKYYNDDLSNGQDVETAIHLLLQSYTDVILIRAKIQLKAKEVLAMVMNSKTGEILTIASSNRYNPLRIRQKDISRLNPKFAQYPYEPGAVMMPFTVAMSLNAHMGKRNKEKKWINTDYDKFPIGNGYTISDDHKQVAQTMGDVIVNSSNIGIAQIGMELTGNIVHYALTKYGFGQKSGIDLPRDLAGVIKSEELLENKTHRANTAYGYGIMATPIQLLKAYSMFSNDGKLVTPHIGTSEVYEAEEVLYKGNAKKVKSMLIENVKRGTAKNAQIKGLTIGGKTGTAHIAKEGKYSNDYHSSFYGFVEDSAGHSYTLGVLVIEPKTKGMYFASRSAVPVAREVIKSMISRGLLTPSSEKNEIQEQQKLLHRANKRLNIISTKREISQYTGETTISPLKHATVHLPFGMHEDSVYKVKVFNESVTLNAQKGFDKVFSVFEGKVIFAGKSSILGKVVVLAHKNKLHTVYAGLSKIAPYIRVGTYLKKGDVLGKVEKKLIFQVTQGKKFVNPLDVIEL